MRAWEQIDGLRRRDMGRVRDFVAGARLTGFPLSSLEDGVVLGLLRTAIKGRDLAVLRRSAGAAQAPERATAEQRRLVRTIERKTGRSLSYAGRRYRLVADADLARSPDRNSYEVVPNRDAAAVLDGLAKQSSTNADLVSLLAEARTKLAADWRQPQLPEGLIVLKRILAPGSVRPSSEPALTPSQLQQQLEPVEKVHPMIDGTPVELDLSEVDLPAESDESEQSDGAEAAEDSEAASETADAEESGKSPHER